jgi:hypothetical protein
MSNLRRRDIETHRIQTLSPYQESLLAHLRIELARQDKEFATRYLEPLLAELRRLPPCSS